MREVVYNGTTYKSIRSFVMAVYPDIGDRMQIRIQHRIQQRIFHWGPKRGVITITEEDKKSFLSPPKSAKECARMGALASPWRASNSIKSPKSDVDV